MKQLSKQQQAEWQKHQEAVEEAKDMLEDGIETANQHLDDGWAVVEERLGELNRAITAANEWRANVAGDMETYYDERSEGWQEGEAGERYTEWLDAWDEELPEAEVDRPDDFEMPSIDALDMLQGLPEEPAA